MPPQSNSQDPSLLDGASSRFADAFVRRTTKSSQGTNPRPRPWKWLVAAGALTAVAVLVVFAVANLPSDSSDSADKKKTAAADVVSPAASARAPHNTASARGKSDGGRAVAPGTGGSGGGSGGGSHGLPVTKESGGIGGDVADPPGAAHPPSAPAGTGPASGPGSASGASNGGSSSGDSPGTTTQDSTQRVQSDAAPGVSVYSHDSGRCISAPAAKDGTRLQIWDCDGSSSQKVDFRSDGTARMYGLCMDLAGASDGSGTPVQLARCNGGWAQKFKVNKAHDLVNTAIGKCVDITDKHTANGTKLQLWTCYGTDNQKWSKR
ncbi:ricin-type beta-trefoil lectin domain protein [Streptomyces rubrogriseus]|uniref:ricin-type beta-trefoil lectin domain protein n=1 Tax=Streptomyces rubrogriseus TaxID=194673 RepID=UPI000D5A1835|nr:RICIN domain-containing protein [Streptomyces rubrogriseus]